MIKTALLVATAALSLSACQKTQDEAFGVRVRAYLLEHPEVLQEVAEKLREKEQVELAQNSAAAIDRHRAQLERDPRDLVLNPNGQVTVVEFYDYRCGYCKIVAPQVLALARQNPDVRFVFKEFPIFGEVSDTAARLALTSQAKTKGPELHAAWMADRALNDASLDQHMRDAGLDPAVLRRAAASPAIQRHLLDTRALAQALRIEGTPAFVVGNTIIPGADVDALKAAIAQAREGPLKRPGKA